MTTNNTIFPQYDGRSLLNVVSTIEHFWKIKSDTPELPKQLTKRIEGCSQLIFFLIDGLGMNLFNKHAKRNSFFSQAMKSNNLQTITSIFPSTTVAALSTIHTGLPPKTHGLLEWNLYFDEVDEIVNPLPYKRVMTSVSKTHQPRIGKNLLYKGKTIYQKLNSKNVESVIFYPTEYANSYYSKILLKGSRLEEYQELDDLLKKLIKVINLNRDNRYIFVYISSLDALQHSFGPDSFEVKAHFTKIETTLQSIINSIKKDFANKVGIIITSDHGHIQTSPKHITFLNSLGFEDSFKLSKHSKLILPTGNMRDLFLSIKDSDRINTIKKLKFLLKGKAEVKSLNERLIQKLFGNFSKHIKFSDRLGNILILPKENHLVWYKYLETDNFLSFGKHGGLSKDEMLIPLIINQSSALTSSSV